ncbi:MAG: tRNA (guanosine(46)-N7)-methyltransferase TrmB [Chitinophagaceae bacterium]|nr:tRNA (guanosine(46)-N7)-methyltransferase TrmB [Chitinophagaceae bacterium]
MGQKKLQRFAEIRTFRNVLEYPLHMKGKWATFFGNENPLTLELACGKGEYAVGLGRLHSDRNFIGIDLKGNRIWVGAKKALEEKLGNVAFVRSQIDKTDQYFSPGEVSEIWITFPDPQLRTSRARKRLTHPHFLRIYQSFLAPGGKIHLKTDSPDLYIFTKLVIDFYNLELLVDNADVYASADIPDDLKIQTYYECLDISKSKKIHYLQFVLPEKILEARDGKLKELIIEREVSRRGA